MTKKQKLIIGGVAVIFIVLLAGLGIMILPNLSNIVFPPTQAVMVMPVSNTEISYPVSSPTERPTFTEQPTPTIRIKKPTWTPYPTITPWPSPVILPTQIPNPTRITSTQVPYKPDCSAQYNYIKALHQYYVDYINSTYNQQISYLQSLKVQATAHRDALRLLQLQRQIDQLNAQRDTDINTESARYEADRANLDAQCQ
jgi:hypothetical protein